MKKYLICFSLFISFSFSLYAQRGCVASGIPFQTDGTLYTSYNSSTGAYDLYGSKVVNPSTLYCMSSTGRNCLVKGLGTYSGMEYTYGTLPCPIDSGSNVLIFFTLCYAVVRFKRFKA